MIQDTSQKAYIEDVVPTLGERQLEVLTALRSLGEATNSELSVRLNWTINRVTPRVYELRKAGKVIDLGKRPCTVTGRMAYVWAISASQLKLL